MAPRERHDKVSDHKQNVRMLVLETDDTHPDTRKDRGGFGDILDELLREAGEKHDPKLGIETDIQFVIEEEGGRVPKLEDLGDDIHAILITGSRYDAHGNNKWILKLMSFIRDVWTHRPDIRFTGICFGHQILCRTLGSQVKPSATGEWELSHTSIQLTPIGRRLFGLSGDTDHISLHQMHLDHVVAPPSPETTDLLPPGTQVHVWGSSDLTGVQGVYIQKRLFTSQGHMEFDEVMTKRQLDMRVEAGSIEDYEAEEASERADWMHDGMIVAMAVLRFFHGDNDNIK